MIHPATPATLPPPVAAAYPADPERDRYPGRPESASPASAPASNTQLR
jgi:hypothetical protein